MEGGSIRPRCWSNHIWTEDRQRVLWVNRWLRPVTVGVFTEAVIPRQWVLLTSAAKTKNPSRRKMPQNEHANVLLLLQWCRLKCACWSCLCPQDCDISRVSNLYAEFNYCFSWIVFQWHLLHSAEQCASKWPIPPIPHSQAGPTLFLRWTRSPVQRSISVYVLGKRRSWSPHQDTRHRGLHMLKGKVLTLCRRVPIIRVLYEAESDAEEITLEENWTRIWRAAGIWIWIGTYYPSRRRPAWLLRPTPQGWLPQMEKWWVCWRCAQLKAQTRSHYQHSDHLKQAKGLEIQPNAASVPSLTHVAEVYSA